MLCFSTLPEDGTRVLKAVGVNTCHVLCFMICILLHVIECTCWCVCVCVCVCVCIYIYIECKKMHGKSNIKKLLGVWCQHSATAYFFDTPLQSQLRSIDVLQIKCLRDLYDGQYYNSVAYQLFLKTLLSYQADIIGFIMLLFKL
jgi:hypothetical protein